MHTGRALILPILSFGSRRIILSKLSQPWCSVEHPPNMGKAACHELLTSQIWMITLGLRCWQRPRLSQLPCRLCTAGQSSACSWGAKEPHTVHFFNAFGVLLMAFHGFSLTNRRYTSAIAHLRQLCRKIIARFLPSTPAETGSAREVRLFESWRRVEAHSADHWASAPSRLASTSAHFALTSGRRVTWNMKPWSYAL